MKKPEKGKSESWNSVVQKASAIGYNSAINDYEAFLPSKAEIAIMLYNYLPHDKVGEAAKAIAKRIGK